MLLIDLPLCIGTTGSLAAFYVAAERAQGRRAVDALVTLPALLALGAGLAPHQTRAVFDGLRNMAGEFVRTPKTGQSEGAKKRYRAAAELPVIEIGLCLFSIASVIASVETGHWFATPFAMIFALGYGYVAFMVASEQHARRKAAAQTGGIRVSSSPNGSPAADSVPPPAPASSEELAA
jgi:hypothetical protein